MKNEIRVNRRCCWYVDPVSERRKAKWVGVIFLIVSFLIITSSFLSQRN